MCCNVLLGWVSGACRVYFHKTGDSDTDYLVDHSIIMYLIDPAGDFVTFYGEQLLWSLVCCTSLCGL